MQVGFYEDNSTTYLILGLLRRINCLLVRCSSTRLFHGRLDVGQWRKEFIGKANGRFLFVLDHTYIFISDSRMVFQENIREFRHPVWSYSANSSFYVLCCVQSFVIQNEKFCMRVKFFSS